MFVYQAIRLLLLFWVEVGDGAGTREEFGVVLARILTNILFEIWAVNIIFAVF